MSCKMCFLKRNRLLELGRLTSNLFHSMIVDGKGVFKKAVLCVKKGKLGPFLCYIMNILRESK